jgi:hypothetical protein
MKLSAVCNCECTGNLFFLEHAGELCIFILRRRMHGKLHLIFWHLSVAVLLNLVQSVFRYYDSCSATLLIMSKSLRQCWPEYRNISY